MTRLSALLLAITPLALLAGSGAAQPVQQKRTNWVNVVQRTPDGGYRQGNPNAAVKLIEYGSRSCPTCGRFAQEGVEPLRAKYIATGKVSYEYREFPVHAQDIANILLGRCVSPRAFFPVLDAMYAEQPALNGRAQQITEAEAQRIAGLPVHEGAIAWARAFGYIAFMAKRGVPEARSLQCLRSAAELKVVSDMIDGGVALGVRGTPSFFLNGRRLNGHGWPQIELEIKAAIGG